MLQPSSPQLSVKCLVRLSWQVPFRLGFWAIGTLKFAPAVRQKGNRKLRDIVLTSGSHALSIQHAACVESDSDYQLDILCTYFRTFLECTLRGHSMYVHM